MTKKPCPACKTVHPERRSDEICHECSKLIKEAIDHRKCVKKGKIHAIFDTWEPHHNETYYRGSESDDGDETARAIWELAKAVSVPYHDYTNDESDESPPALLGKCNMIYHPENQVLIDPDVAEALIRLNRAIHKLSNGAYENGKRYGHSLLVRLASGEIGVNEFESRR